MKTGEGAHRDDIGRFYTFYTETELQEHLHAVGFTVQNTRTGMGRGLAGTLDAWVTILSVAS